MKPKQLVLFICALVVMLMFYNLRATGPPPAATQKLEAQQELMQQLQQQLLEQQQQQQQLQQQLQHQQQENKAQTQQQQQDLKKLQEERQQQLKELQAKQQEVVQQLEEQQQQQKQELLQQLEEQRQQQQQDLQELQKQQQQQAEEQELQKEEKQEERKQPQETEEGLRVMASMATHDRIGYVRLSLQAWEESTHSANANLFIFDDHSKEYTVDELKEWAPSAAQVTAAKPKKKGPDAMSRLIVETFLDSDYDILIILDSDLLVARDWYASLLQGLGATEGVLSLYRSAAKKHFSKNCQGVVCDVNSMGNAGSVWRKDLALQMLKDMGDRIDGFDWGWSEWCATHKVPMQSLKSSAVLHIGMHGSWSHETSSEKSVGFPLEQLSPDISQRATVFLSGKKPKL